MRMSDEQIIEAQKKGIESCKREIAYFVSTLPMTNYSEKTQDTIRMFHRNIRDHEEEIRMRQRRIANR